ncbi:MAG: RNA-binding protein [Rhodobiaceae bacterium]|nr:RNA-binding protein [Rhodobiaceae bacterium]
MTSLPTPPAPEAGDDDLRDDGPRSGRRRDPQRTCVVSRKPAAETELIRFVLDPEGRVVADLKRRLPGRGVWVTARADTLGEAVRRKAFARGFRRQVSVPETLVADVEGALRAAALGMLGLARKAGDLVTGFAKVEAALRSGEAACVLHASEAAQDGVEKLAAAARAGAARLETGLPPVWRLFSGDELGLALGGTNVVHAAARKGRQGGAACTAVARLARFVDDGAA